MKKETLVTKLTPAQTQAAVARADRKAAAVERAASTTIRANDLRVAAMWDIAKPVAAKKAPKATKKIRWSGAELETAIGVYLQYTIRITSAVNNPKAVAEVQAKFPKRNYGSVNMLFTQIRGLDTQAPQEGLTDTSQILINKLYSVDPIRFPGGATQEDKLQCALDNLLDEIRG